MLLDLFPTTFFKPAIWWQHKSPTKDARPVVSALIKQAKKLPSELYKSLTWDRGKELAAHRQFNLGDRHRRLLLRSEKSMAAGIQ